MSDKIQSEKYEIINEMAHVFHFSFLTFKNFELEVLYKLFFSKEDSCFSYFRCIYYWNLILIVCMYRYGTAVGFTRYTSQLAATMPSHGHLCFLVQRCTAIIVINRSLRAPAAHFHCPVTHRLAFNFFATVPGE